MKLTSLFIVSECGDNAFCQDSNEGKKCKCIEGYEGDPLTSCKVMQINFWEKI